MPRSFRGFSTRFMRATDRVIPPISFLSSSTQAAPVETITVKKIDGTLTITLVSVIQISNGRLTQGVSNTCTMTLGTPINALKVFLNGF